MRIPTARVPASRDNGSLKKLQGVHALHLRPAYFMKNLLANIDMIRAFNDELITPNWF